MGSEKGKKKREIGLINNDIKAVSVLPKKPPENPCSCSVTPAVRKLIKREYL